MTPDTKRFISRGVLWSMVGLALGWAISTTGGVSYLVGQISDVTDSTRADLRKSAEPSAQLNGDPFTPLISAVSARDNLAANAELYRLLHATNPQDFPKLVERTQRLPLGYREAIIPEIAKRWLQIDRSSAEQWIRTSRPDAGCYRAWAEVAPREALDGMLASGGAPPFPDAVKKALDNLAGADPRARLELLAQYLPSPDRDSVINANFTPWIEDEPKGALDWIASVPPGKLNQDLEARALQGLLKKDPAAAVKHLEAAIAQRKAGLVGNNFVSIFTKLLADKDPQAAREFAERLPGSINLSPLIAAGIAWANSDPQAALEWSRASGIDPAMPFRTEFGPSGHILGQAIKSNPEAVVNWLLALPPGGERDRLLEAAAKWFPATASSALLHELFQQLSPERQMSAAANLGRQMVIGREFPNDSEWASLIPDETIRARAMGAAIAQVFVKDASKAESIMATLLDDPARDQALSRIAMQPRSTEDGLVRALTISDATLRYDTMDQLVRRWLSRDTTAAKAWLDSQSDLPQDWLAEWNAEVHGSGRF